MQRLIAFRYALCNIYDSRHKLDGSKNLAINLVFEMEFIFDPDRSLWLLILLRFASRSACNLNL